MGPSDSDASYTDLNAVDKNFTSASKHISYTLAEVNKGIAQGQLLFMNEGKVYNVSTWIKNHPGGELCMTHLIGKDATDHIRAFHPKSVLENALPIFEVGLYIAPKKTAAEMKVHKLFQKLVLDVEALGHHETELGFYAFLLFRYAVVWISGVAAVLLLPKWWNALVGGLLMAASWQQIAFFCHDAGHNGISHTRHLDYSVGVLLASFFGGLSLGWWKDSHNVHHLVTNHPNHDPDIQHLPIMAASPLFFTSLFSTYHGRILNFDWIAQSFVKYQYIGFWIGNLFGRFVLYGFSCDFLLKDKPEARPYRAAEMIGIAVFFCWYGGLVYMLDNYLVGIMFVLISHLFASILHLQIQISHVSMNMDCKDCDEHFATKALRTTMDVDCPEWLDWFHGGLQFQVVHHLFPRVPRHNLRKVKPLVVQFAKDTGILKYETHTFFTCTGMVHEVMFEVAQQLQFLLKHGGEKLHF